MLTCLLFAGTVFLSDGIAKADNIVAYSEVSSYESGEFGMIMKIETANEPFDFIISPYVQGMDDDAVMTNCIKAPIAVDALPVPKTADVKIKVGEINADEIKVRTPDKPKPVRIETDDKPAGAGSELKKPQNSRRLGVAPFPKEAPVSPVSNSGG